MDERVGLLTKEQEKLVAEALDNFFTFKNRMVERLDKLMFTLIVRTGDNVGLDKLQDEWKARLIPVIDAAIAKDVEAVKKLGAEALDTSIDIPLVGDDTEKLVFSSFTTFLVSAVVWFSEKKESDKLN